MRRTMQKKPWAYLCVFPIRSHRERSLLLHDFSKGSGPCLPLQADIQIRRLGFLPLGFLCQKPHCCCEHVSSSEFYPKRLLDCIAVEFSLGHLQAGRQEGSSNYRSCGVEDFQRQHFARTAVGPPFYCTVMCNALTTNTSQERQFHVKPYVHREE